MSAQGTIKALRVDGNVSFALNTHDIVLFLRRLKRLRISLELLVHKNHNCTISHLSAHMLCFRAQQTDRIPEKMKRGHRTSITDPESAVRDKGHRVPITVGSVASVFKHLPVSSAMCSMFAGACHCVWGWETEG